MANKMLLIAFDPGKTGGYATMDTSLATPLIEWGAMPLVGKDFDGRTIRTLMEDCDKVFIEKVTSFACMGQFSAFQFGTGWGILQGIAVGLGLSYELVTPKQWQVMTTGRQKGAEGKNQSRAMAMQLFPECAKECKLKSNDGIAEAILIAEYARRNLV